MGNIYKQFQELLPKKKQLIGVVQSINTVDKTSVVQLLSGTNIIVRGTNVSEGKTCLIEDNTIKEELPTLQVYNITIY